MNIAKFKLDYSKLISGSISLGLLVITLFILQYVAHIDSISIFLIAILLAAVVFWKLLRMLYGAKECKKLILLLINTTLLVLLGLIALYLTSAEILMKLNLAVECKKAIDCTWNNCPISFDISDICYFAQQFLAANIQFTGIEVIYLVLAYGIATLTDPK